ncbi:MAG TPA: aminotransferase class V-fold PLP-dependent enzyme [Phycisphaerae bacterium]|nr:aminotransferase class V-fold PLP-dependent enzyme [Phycisphaerae bacterium]HOJ75568.1 aminotransferase class V-fold PLP-dependent enzyme [Phycisphaerae bacterium]HOM50222.1 aminotransferase class V-fold PLP-dependent enzyme [Phycisphaerae bacterium]HON65018.1 aminotransferase class V-fold PLP-dependent enzyme [Phycisphaerae bacterium]HOQ86844.1 aminotransferase class V-fold PLP-dependent enzyme [Phycisphaerae bacterium]
MSVIYLDNAATSWPKPPCVEQAMSRFLAHDAGNPGRAGHRMAIACERMLDRLRVQLSRLFDAPDPQRVIFTLNTTDAINIALKGVLRSGDHVVTTTLEHNSVSRPLQALADAGTITLTRVPATDDGFIAPADIAAAITPTTRLIACTHCSNVLGTIQPIDAIGALARDRGLLLLVDAAQSAGVLPISMRQMHIDLLAVAGHKSLLGPPGTGALLLSDRVDAAPWREGGTGGDSSHPVQPAEYPYRLEAGTPNTVGLAGWAAALEEIERIGPGNMLEHERKLAARFTDAFRGDDRVRLLGPDDPGRRTGIVVFTMESIAPQELAALLDESFGIAVRAGLHCAPYIHRQLGTFPDGAVRVSPGPYNTVRDIDLLIDAVRLIRDQSEFVS